MGVEFFYNFLRFMLLAFEILIIGRVILSYVEPAGRSSLAQFLIAVTEPILAPIRRLLPRSGMFDFSPLIVILVLGMIVRYLPA